ncbi:hypothetical protein AGMMS50233_08980 [Endomicrobiia bacterium]|nr:hypothetical protein AGMMS50233_08980 [Endomicrobiia bacterium]
MGLLSESKNAEWYSEYLGHLVVFYDVSDDWACYAFDLEEEKENFWFNQRTELKTIERSEFSIDNGDEGDLYLLLEEDSSGNFEVSLYDWDSDKFIVSDKTLTKIAKSEIDTTLQNGRRMMSLVPGEYGGDGQSCFWRIKQEK